MRYVMSTPSRYWMRCQVMARPRRAPRRRFPTLAGAFWLLYLALVAIVLTACYATGYTLAVLRVIQP